MNGASSDAGAWRSAEISRKWPRPAPVPMSAINPQWKPSGLDQKKGTAAKVRVLVEWRDHKKSWTTVGVSENVIEASWFALTDAIRLELMRLMEEDEEVEKAVEDYCWGV